LARRIAEASVSYLNALLKAICGEVAFAHRGIELLLAHERFKGMALCVFAKIAQQLRSAYQQRRFSAKKEKEQALQFCVLKSITASRLNSNKPRRCNLEKAGREARRFAIICPVHSVFSRGIDAKSGSNSGRTMN
jgi:hypothetical protein